ncbi:PLP-dependent aminotransferase family protein, partial [bacterium]|nr:PLP-dependent aminotransferase family protein [bacterium]
MEIEMFEQYFSERIKNTPPSFIRESLKVIKNPEVISFAGGLPNPVSFPQKELQISMNRICEKYGDRLYQYAGTMGLNSLREYIVERYRKTLGVVIDVENVIITTGSQQSLDLLGKVFINSGDSVLIENPSYLGFLQAFCMYDAKFVPVELNKEGLDIEGLKRAVERFNPKIAYLIPNFQNPTGISYSKENREAVFEVLKDEDIILVQDDPYGELGFEETERLKYIGQGLSNKNIYLGSFSKIIAPGMRLGYMIADKEIVRMVETAKQAADLHTNVLSQYLITDYLENNDLDTHIKKIRELYRTQANAMVTSMEKHFPEGIEFTRPKGG